MLKSITLRNFRAFRHQTFDFGKINIFVGPNNSGKSSAVSAINLIAQTIIGSEFNSQSLVLNGAFDSLGTFLDLVHGNRSNTPIGIDFSYDQYAVRTDYKYRSQRREMEIVRFELCEGGKQVVHYASQKDSFNIKLAGKELETILPGWRKRRPVFRSIIPHLRLNPVAVGKEFEGLPEDVKQRVYRAERSLSRARMNLRSIFENFDSISPFRERPSRTYLYSGEAAERIGSTGGNTAAILASDTSRRGSESRDMVAEVSRWFQVTGIAKGIKVKSLTPRLFEIAVVDARNAEHNICDVGFGCSQVLPVLTASLKLFRGIETYLYRNSPILVVQEPEIHLHPNAQAALGSFFAGLLQGRGQLFIETHSDNLVLRIARHVADGTLAPGDVRIFYVHKEDGHACVKNLTVSERGIFTPPWPGGFFPQRESESLSLARAGRFGRSERAEAQLEFKYPEEA